MYNEFIGVNTEAVAKLLPKYYFFMREVMKYISYTQKITSKSICKKLIDNMHAGKWRNTLNI